MATKKKAAKRAPKMVSVAIEREIPVTNEIKMFFHCGRCLEEKPEDQSPREWAQLEVGWTVLGFQVWCKRHEINVVHMDFQGAKHPASMAVEGEG